MGRVHVTRSSLDVGTSKKICAMRSCYFLRTLPQSHTLFYSSRVYVGTRCRTLEGAIKEIKKDKKSKKGSTACNSGESLRGQYRGFTRLGPVPWSHDTIVFKICIYIVSARATQQPIHIGHPGRSPPPKSRLFVGIKAGKGGKRRTSKDGNQSRSST